MPRLRAGGEMKPPSRLVLYRHWPCVKSGAGQLLLMQARALRASGLRADIAGRRRRLRFLLRTGCRVARLDLAGARRLAASRACFVIDHEMRVPEAAVVFVHNLMTEARRYVAREDWEAKAGEEALFFEELRGDAVLVANSELVRQALLRSYRLGPGRVVVHHPGYRADRFNLERKSRLRAGPRRELGLAEGQPLIGFVTSGELDKRGLDVFIETAERMLDARADARFLVVGARRLPGWAAEHWLVRRGLLSYRPKVTDPGPWYAALDLFLYPAHWEEFGMVVSEAQAMGLPVLTSRRVGAAECLPPGHSPWLLETPEPDGFAESALRLLADDELRRSLGAESAAYVTRYDQASYAAAAVSTILKTVDSSRS